MKILKLDWASHDSARVACKKWHYSKCLPTGKLVKIGVWEDALFIGVVIYSRGASPWLPAKFGLPVTDICELTRVAMTKHEAPVSRILALSLKFLRKFCPGVRLVVSFADPFQGHYGGIYQAGNWVYTGRSNETTEYLVRGRWRHTRAVYHQVKGKEYPKRTMPGKHRYLYPLDDNMRADVEKLREPYPKHAPEAEIDEAVPLPGEGGRFNSDPGAPVPRGAS